MRNKTDCKRHAVLILAVAGLITSTAPFLTSSGLAYAQAPAPSWSYTGSLKTARLFHTTTLLANGKVLVTGGCYDAGCLSLDSAELYDPVTGAWGLTGAPNVDRVEHSATLLPNGKVLVAGGWNRGVVGSAELYDPVAGTWSFTGNLNVARADHTATLLPNGKVLVAGGDTLETELYDPATGTWSITGNLNTARQMGHTQTLLPSGKILVAGGTVNSEWSFNNLASCELYDPNTGTWSLTGSLNVARFGLTATLLPNGNVLVTGGESQDGAINNSAELYNPTTETWSYTGSLSTGRYGHTATLLPNGKVLVAGGHDWHSNTYLDSADVYDPATGNWSGTAKLNVTRLRHTAVLLQSGKVLVVGGSDANRRLLSAELYDSGSSSTINPIDDPHFFVRQQYLDFFGREPDAIGFQNWTDTLTKCANGGFGEFDNPDCDRVHVSAGFVQSNEFQGRGYWILRFGFVGLNRSIGSVRSSATYAEFTSALQQIGGANSPSQEETAKVAFTKAFVQRSDFQALFPSSLSNSQYVNGLESKAGVTLSNKQALIDALNNMSMTRADVLRNVVESQVAFDKFIIPSFVTMEYFGYLRRDVDEIGYRNWVETLQTDPTNYRHMIFGFIYSTEYRQRFGSP